MPKRKMPKRKKHLAFWQRQLDEHRQWFNERGACIASYVERYGSGDDPNCYGDGGELIYAADYAALHHAEQMVLSLREAA